MVLIARFAFTQFDVVAHVAHEWRILTNLAGLLLGFAALWVISPIDLIPEFIPVVGPLDDVVVVALVLRHVLKKAGRAVAEEHWTGDPAIFERIMKLSGAN